MNKHYNSYWSSSEKNHSVGRQRRLSFFLWVRDRAIKQFHERGGLALAAATALVPATARAAEFTVDTLSDSDADGATLREAIVAANATAEADTIKFADGLTGSIVLSQGVLSITSDVAITGPEDKITISGNDLTQLINIELADVALANLILTGGDATNGGAIATNQATLQLTNCEVRGNNASSQGGGLYSTLSELTLTDCEFTSNNADGNGGGIRTSNCELELTNCLVSENTSADSGGGVYSAGALGNGSFLSLTNCEVADNSAINNENQAATGGGIASYNLDEVVVSNCLLSGNTSGGNRFTAGTGGGMIANYIGDLIVTNSTFSGNEGEFFGGGLSTQSATFVSVSNTTIYGNTSNVAGGIGIYGATNAVLTNCTVAGNQTGLATGGGVYSRASGTIDITNCSITGNSASTDGGGIYFARTDVNLANSLVAFNRASANDHDLALRSISTLNLISPNLFSAIDETLSNVNQIIETSPEEVFATTAEMNGIVTGELADNGGPVSTIKILQGGLAEEAGANSILPTDSQDLDEDGDTTETLPVDARGFPRIAEARVDLGAFEFTASYDLESQALTLTLEGLTVDGDLVLSFDSDYSLTEGQSMVVSRSTDLNSFSPIFVFDGTSVTSEEDGNLSSLEQGGSLYTITDTAPPEPKAFYKLEVATD
ncbi:MAG: right-handed parallel beta-helix repeat-containing protein [Verrucomicrobiota bacterium JB023]|nr:right-handed parallel beta-helix repeat-containing protein [Verrucomicrobiota bacterium JB023]